MRAVLRPQARLVCSLAAGLWDYKADAWVRLRQTRPGNACVGQAGSLCPESLLLARSGHRHEVKSSSATYRSRALGFMVLVRDRVADPLLIEVVAENAECPFRHGSSVHRGNNGTIECAFPIGLGHASKPRSMNMAKLYAGLDVSDKSTSICILSVTGDIVLETSATTDIAAIGDVLKPYRRLLDKVGHESCAKAMWLNKELKRKKWPAVCLDAMHTHAALAANKNKTDKNDARGIAEVLCRGIYTTAYVRSDMSQTWRSILTHRRAMIRKRIDLESLAASNLKLIGGKLVRDGDGWIAKAQTRRRLDPDFARVLDGTLGVIDALRAEAERLDTQVVKLAKSDAVCKRLMTMPGVGPITAFSFKTAVDDPTRFASSRTVAAHFGLTPRTFQSGESSYIGHISKRGDSEVRSLLYQSAACLLNASKTPWRLRLWGKELVKNKGFKVAATACARRMAVILHRMWVTEQDFQLTT